LEGEKNQGNN